MLADYSHVLAREAGEWERLRNAHLAYYVAYAERYTADYQVLEAGLANLMAAAKWSRESGEGDGVLALAAWLYVGGGEFLDLQGHAREAVLLLDWTVAVCRAVGDRRGRFAGSDLTRRVYSICLETVRIRYSLQRGTDLSAVIHRWAESAAW